MAWPFTTKKDNITIMNEVEKHNEIIWVTTEGKHIQRFVQGALMNNLSVPCIGTELFLTDHYNQQRHFQVTKVHVHLQQKPGRDGSMDMYTAGYGKGPAVVVEFQEFKPKENKDDVGDRSRDLCNCCTCGDRSET